MKLIINNTKEGLTESMCIIESLALDQERANMKEETYDFETLEEEAISIMETMVFTDQMKTSMVHPSEWSDEWEINM